MAVSGAQKYPWPADGVARRGRSPNPAFTPFNGFSPALASFRLL